jgi:copper homeostasis protein
MLEICIDSVASARAAAAGGADRVELCANLPEGGTTPSVGMIAGVRAAFDGGLMVIVRPRGYDFLYSEDELAVMAGDIRAARAAGADGVVIGCLDAGGQVDGAACARLLEAAGPLDITFHRAFDMARDLAAALEAVAALGIRRVLSSGGRRDVAAGLAVLAGLVRQAAGRVSVMPGGGVVPESVSATLAATGADEIHLSARRAVASGMVFRNPDCHMGDFSRPDEYAWKEACAGRVRAARLAHDAALAARAAAAGRD